MVPAFAMESGAVTGHQMNTEAIVVVVAVVDEATDIALQAGLGWLSGPESVIEPFWVTEALLALWRDDRTVMQGMMCLRASGSGQCRRGVTGDRRSCDSCHVWRRGPSPWS